MKGKYVKLILFPQEQQSQEPGRVGGRRGVEKQEKRGRRRQVSLFPPIALFELRV